VCVSRTAMTSDPRTLMSPNRKPRPTRAKRRPLR
jgi:hypothetical protein